MRCCCVEVNAAPPTTTTFLCCLENKTKKCAEWLSLSFPACLLSRSCASCPSSIQPFVACQQPRDASQAYVVYLVGRRPSGRMTSLPAELPRDVSFPITSATQKGCRRHRFIFSLFPDSQYFRSHTQRLLRVTSTIEVIQPDACSCLLELIQNQVGPRNPRIKMTAASE